jgi:hypothetical protein
VLYSLFSIYTFDEVIRKCGTVEVGTLVACTSLFLQKIKGVVAAII